MPKGETPPGGNNKYIPIDVEKANPPILYLGNLGTACKNPLVPAKTPNSKRSRRNHHPSQEHASMTDKLPPSAATQAPEDFKKDSIWQEKETV